MKLRLMISRNWTCVWRGLSRRVHARSQKLLKLTLDIGNETRTVFAGIKSAYDPANWRAG